VRGATLPTFLEMEKAKTNKLSFMRGNFSCVFFHQVKQPNMSTFQCLKVAQIRMLRTMIQLLAVMMAHVSMTSSRRRRRRKDFLVRFLVGCFYQCKKGENNNAQLN
jgi:hypothetical protein